MMNSHSQNAVVFTVDHRMFYPCIVVADEVSRVTGAENYDVIVLAAKGSVPNEFSSWHEQRGGRFSVIEVDFSAAIPEHAVLTSRFPASSMFRLQLPEFFGGRYRKILYMDADTEVARPVDQLFNLDLGGSVIAASDDLTSSKISFSGKLSNTRTQQLRRHAGLSPSGNERYCSSGVVLIDVEQWRHQSISKRALNFLTQNPEMCAFPDQDALNVALPSTYSVLSPNWNFRADVAALQPLRPKYIEPSIVHFVGEAKPWIVDQWPGDPAAARRYTRFFANVPWLTVHTSRRVLQNEAWLEALSEYCERSYQPPESAFRRSGRRFERMIRHKRKQMAAALQGRKYVPDGISERHQRCVACYIQNTPFADIAQNLVPPIGSSSKQSRAAAVATGLIRRQRAATF